MYIEVNHLLWRQRQCFSPLLSANTIPRISWQSHIAFTFTFKTNTFHCESPPVLLIVEESVCLFMGLDADESTWRGKGQDWIASRKEAIRSEIWKKGKWTNQCNAILATLIVTIQICDRYCVLFSATQTPKRNELKSKVAKCAKLFSVILVGVDLWLTSWNL